MRADTGLHIHWGKGWTSHRRLMKLPEAWTWQASSFDPRLRPHRQSSQLRILSVLHGTEADQRPFPCLTACTKRYAASHSPTCFKSQVVTHCLSATSNQF